MVGLLYGLVVVRSDLKAAALDDRRGVCSGGLLYGLVVWCRGLQVASVLLAHPARVSAMRFSSMHWLRLMGRLSLW